MTLKNASVVVQLTPTYTCNVYSTLCFACEYLLPLLEEATNMIRGVPKEIVYMKDELESTKQFRKRHIAEPLKGSILHG